MSSLNTPIDHYQAQLDQIKHHVKDRVFWLRPYETEETIRDLLTKDNSEGWEIDYGTAPLNGYYRAVVSLDEEDWQEVLGYAFEQ